MTPLQQLFKRLIEQWEAKHGEHMTGGKLAQILGKSRNLLSQIMNDGLVPSGEVLVKLGQVLEAGDDDIRELMISAMKTKALGRARDTFWLAQALELGEILNGRIKAFTQYLKETDQLEEFEQWIEKRPLRRDLPAALDEELAQHGLNGSLPATGESPATETPRAEDGQDGPSAKDSEASA